MLASMVDETKDSNADPRPRRLVVGLGNPGQEYAGTRHNVGFEILDRLVQDCGLRFRRQERVRGLGPVKARVADFVQPGEDGTEERTLFVKPWTYMNLSGEAVAAYARFFGLAPEAIFVIYDDLHLPLGRIRIRPGGSPGGHNGIKSLIACLGSEGFPRLRTGIAVTDLDASMMADPDFVLGRFGEEERELLEPTIERCCRATREWMQGRPLQELMSQHNAATSEAPAASPSDSSREAGPETADPASET